MSGFEALQQKLVQAKAVMDRADGIPSNKKNTQGVVNESSNPNLPLFPVILIQKVLIT